MTPTDKPRVLVVYDQPQQFRDALETRFPTASFHFATTGAEVKPALAAADPNVILSIKHPAFPGHEHRPVIDHASVRWVHVGGSGYEQFVPWEAKRITLTNSAGVLSRFLAETITGAILLLNSNFLGYLSSQRRAEWRPLGFTPLENQTLLIVGVGAIGGALADNVKALGMRVLGIRSSDQPHRSVDRMHKPHELLEVIGEADYVSLHARLTEETTHLIDEPALAAMKKGARLVNTARGAVVDEQALIHSLNAEHLGGAYLDVFETEPLAASSPLWQMENVFITPHASDAVTDWAERFADFFADNLERWCQGEPLLNVIAPPSC